MKECALSTLSRRNVGPVAWALNNLVPVGSSEVSEWEGTEGERDVRVHFALVTDEAPLIPLLTYVGKESSNGAINHSHRSPSSEGRESEAHDLRRERGTKREESERATCCLEKMTTSDWGHCVDRNIVE